MANDPSLSDPWSSVGDRLRRRGLRWTPQRRTVIEVLAGADGHVTGAELVERCRARDPSTIPSTVYRTLDVLEELGLARPGLGWYQATRHTFASQWALNGGSIEKLSKIMGHHSIVVTERYMHLRPDLFAAKDFATISVDLETKPSAVREIGQQLPSRAAN